MRKIMINYIAGCLILTPTLLFAQLGGKFTLKGKIGNLNSPQKIYLAKGLTPKSIVDSSALVDGVFEFKGLLEEPGRMFVVLASNSSGVTTQMKGIEPDYKNFFLDVGETVLTSKDSLIHVVISGASAKLNAESAAMYKALDPVFGEQWAVGDFQRKATAEEQETESFKKTVDAKRAAADAHMYKVIAEFIKANPGSFAGLEGMYGYMNNAPFAVLKETFNLFSEDVKNSPAGRNYNKMLGNMERTAVGFQAPNFTSMDVNGKTVKLSDFKGKYVLIDFWASWCVPCRKENPNVVKAYQKFKDRNFTIMSISLDKSKAPWLLAIEKDKLTWINVCDFKEFGSEAAIKYSIKFIPTNFLIDPNGKIVATNLRENMLDETLQKLLK